MLQRLRAWMKNETALPQTAQAALPSNAVFNGKMSERIALWGGLYRGEAPWLPNGGGLGLASSIACELARQTTLELKSEVSGTGRGAFLNKQYREALRMLRPALEIGCAVGGLVLKPYPDGRGGIAVQMVGAEGFVPTGFDCRGQMTGAIFFETAWLEKTAYTRCEVHALEGDVYTVENLAFRGGGAMVPLSTVPQWEALAKRTVIKGVKRPLFGYFRPPQANWVDPLSPLGVSVYSRAVELIRQADEQWQRILWEFEGGELAVDASEDLFRLTESGRYRLPKGRERLFRVHDVSVMEARGKFLETFSPALRDRSLLNGLESMLRRVEFHCGLAYGTISDPHAVEKTAEEIRAAKQRSYATVADLQRALQAALEELVEAMDVWTTLADLAPTGKYHMSFCWDDSIIIDAEQERARDLQEVGDGLMQRWEYRAKWRGESEQVARSMIAADG